MSPKAGQKRRLYGRGLLTFLILITLLFSTLKAQEWKQVITDHVASTAAQFGLSEEDVQDLTLTDQYLSRLTGTRMQVQEYGRQAAGAGIQLNMVSWAKGIYVVKLSRAGSQVVKRILLK